MTLRTRAILSLAVGKHSIIPVHSRLIHSFYSTSSSSASNSSATTTKNSNICPACSSPLPFTTVPTCPKCSTLLPPPSTHLSHFSLFNLSPNSYDIDLKALKGKFREYQQKVHPDLFTGQGEKEDWAKVWSGRVNDSWKILEGERSRGEYLVSSKQFS